MKKASKEKGITLVALIITIIVLIILAAVSVKIVTDLNIVNLAWSSTENYASGQVTEEQEMNTVVKRIDDTIKSIINAQGGNREEPLEPTASPSIELPQGWNKNTVYAVESTDDVPVIVPVPIGFTVSNTEKSVNAGLVIKQDKTENEFVWIPIENTSEMFGKDENGKSMGKIYYYNTKGAVAYNWTEKNGIMSWINAERFREPDIITSYDDVKEYYVNAKIEGIENAVQFKEKLQEEFENMRKSVEKYGGFYIGRYETGDLSKEKAVVEKGNNDIGGLNWYKQYQKNKTILEGTKVSSSMIWGCQWDAVMRWFLKFAETTQYVTDSTGKGNYVGTQAEGNVQIPTGSNDDYSVKNIYDMAGNMYEWANGAFMTDQRMLRRRIFWRPCKRLFSV